MSEQRLIDQAIEALEISRAIWKLAAEVGDARMVSEATRSIAQCVYFLAERGIDETQGGRAA